MLTTSAHPAAATAGMHSGDIWTMYGGNWGTAYPLVVSDSWLDTSEWWCGDAQYTVTLRMYLPVVYSTKIYVQKLVVAYHSYRGTIGGGALDLFGTSNYFHSTDIFWGAVTAGQTVTRSWTLNKWVPLYKGSVILQKSLIPTFPDTGTIPCYATYSVKFHYHA